MRWVFYILVTAAVIVFYVVDTADDRRRLISLIGLFALIVFGFIFSKAPRKVIWRHVLWGIALQFLLGLMILRWTVGRNVFACMGDKVSRHLNKNLDYSIIHFFLTFIKST